MSQLFDPHCDWPLCRCGAAPPTCHIIMMEARHKAGESPLWAVFSGRLVKMGASEGLQGQRVRSDDGWPFQEMLPRAPDLRHCRAHAVVHVLCPEGHLPVEWWRCDSVVSALSLFRQCWQWPPGRCVRHGRRRILIFEHAFLHHCRGFCAGDPSFS